MLKQVQHDVEWGAFFGSWHGFSRPGCRFSRVGMGTNFRRITRSEALILGVGHSFLEPGRLVLDAAFKKWFLQVVCFPRAGLRSPRGGVLIGVVGAWGLGCLADG